MKNTVVQKPCSIPVSKLTVQGIELTGETPREDFAEMLIPAAIKKHASIKASMLQDLEKGKKCEIEAINGVVKSKGKEYNVLTPINDKVIEIVKKI